MDHGLVDANIHYLKKLKHIDVKAYTSIAKVLEYLLARLDQAPPPSVYYPSEMETRLDDAAEDWADRSDEAVELPLIDVKEPPPVEEEEFKSYISDANVPMVLGVVAAQTPFRLAPEPTPAAFEVPPPPPPSNEAGAKAPPQEGGVGRSEGGSDGGPKPVKVKPLPTAEEKRKAMKQAIARVKALKKARLEKEAEKSVEEK